jgi:hypothetical protein
MSPSGPGRTHDLRPGVGCPTIGAVAKVPDKYPRVTIRIPEALRAHVAEAADRDGRSVSNWIVRALEAAVRAEGAPARPPRKRAT